MVDLLAVVRDHYDGVAGKSLKTVAGKFGAAWHTPDATGADTLDWINTAREQGPDAIDARERLLRYNEDDTRALATLRHALAGG
jgi:predicted RecB family nuclease